MKFICEVTFPKSSAVIIPVEIEALTAGGAIERIHQSLTDAFNDRAVLIFVREVTE